MKYFLKAEFIKLYKKKLIYIMIPLIILPFLISYGFISNSDFLQLHGKYGPFEYIDGMFGTIVVGTGLVVLFFSLIITSFISEEIHSGLIIFQINTIKKRSKLFFSTLLTSVVIACMFIFFTIASTTLGYHLFIKNSIHGHSIDNYNQIFSLIFAALYFLCLILVLSSLSFLGAQKSLIFGSFIYILINVNLADSKILFPYILGSPIFSSIQLSKSALLHLEINQAIVMLLFTFIIILFTHRIFLKRDF